MRLFDSYMMFLRSVFRAAGRAGPFNAVKSSASYLSSSPSVTLPLGCRRYVSAYGYTQAKALIYSKYGEPKDVLRYELILLQLLSLLSAFTFANAFPQAYIHIPSPRRMAHNALSVFSQHP